MSDAPFVHLHVHSSYSLLEGALKIGRLADLAKADRQPALALTDTDNMFGALEFSEKLASSGIQPIVGCCFSIDFGDQPRDPRNPVHTTNAAAHRFAGGARGRLSAPDAAVVARLSRIARERAATYPRGLARGECRGPYRADRRTGRGARPRHRERPARSRAVARGRAARAVRRSALCGASESRPAGGARHRAASDRHRLCAIAAAGRDQRAVLCDTEGLRVA